MDFSPYEPRKRLRRLPAPRLWISLFLALLLGTGVAAKTAAPARAAEPGPEKPGQKASMHTTGPIITDTAIPQPLGTGTIFMPWFLAFTGGNFSPNWRRVSAGGDYTSLEGSLQIYYGVLPRTSVYVVVPYIHNWAARLNQPAPTGATSANFGGLGDLSFTVKHLFFEEKPHFPAISGVFTTGFPTGHHLHLNPGNQGTDQLGSGAFTFTPGINLFKYAPPVLLYANFWYTMYTGAPAAAKRQYYPDRITVNLALEWPLITDRLVFLWELVSYYDAGRLIGPRANQAPEALISTLPALEFLPTKDWAFDVGVLIDLLGKNTSYNFTPTVSLFYNF
jgi:hypothetical protein